MRFLDSTFEMSRSLRPGVSGLIPVPTVLVLSLGIEIPAKEPGGIERSTPPVPNAAGCGP